ncbi:MAG: 4-hydroxy-tetrahydrodipicolinate reductase [Breznakibacter sp.]
MKIALIGYGKMGKEIEKIATERGHEIVCRIDVNGTDAFDSDAFRSSEAAIEFTMPEAAFGNYLKCFRHHIPVVSGTTGWLDKLPQIKEMCQTQGQTFFYASNFSLGVNVFFAINKQLAKLMARADGYDVKMTEVHHTQKLDAPSGTAITLAEGILENLDTKKAWVLANDNAQPTDLQIAAVREGQFPGIHTITYESEVDEISIRHNAKSRKGFALGAVLAAEFVRERKGFLGMNDLLNL